MTGMVALAVDLPTDHPGYGDDAYRARRVAIAEVAERYRAGQPIPEVAYTPEEDALWALVSSELAGKHRRLACREYLAGAARLVLPKERVPQLREVDTRLRALSGFGLRPVAGLVPPGDFYASLADRTFLSTQYVRHPSAPFYTPEPDIVHEIVGHANTLTSDAFASLYERAGRASVRASWPEAKEFFSKVFWFTLEFGVVREGGQIKAYGAGLLSSSGEIDTFRDAERRPFDIVAMGTQDYDITRYQPVLFEAPSFEQMCDQLGAFFDRYGDDWYREQVKGDRS